MFTYEHCVQTSTPLAYIRMKFEPMLCDETNHGKNRKKNDMLMPSKTNEKCHRRKWKAHSSQLCESSVPLLSSMVLLPFSHWMAVHAKWLECETRHSVACSIWFEIVVAGKRIVVLTQAECTRPTRKKNDVPEKINVVIYVRNDEGKWKTHLKAWKRNIVERGIAHSQVVMILKCLRVCGTGTALN